MYLQSLQLLVILALFLLVLASMSSTPFLTASGVSPQLGGRTATDAYQIAPWSTSTMFPLPFASLGVGVFHKIQKY